MLGKEKIYLGVFLDETSLKMVCLKASGNERKLLDVAKHDLRGTEESQWPRIIHEAFMGFQVKNPKVICAVPANVVTTKNIEIPSLDPQEIKSIIDLQAGRHTPYSREEILIGYLNIGTFQRNYTKILLVIINRNVLKKELDLLEQAGLKVDCVYFIPEGMAHFYARALARKGEDIPVGIIDIGQTSTDFIIEFNRTAAMCRNIPVGLMHLIKEGAKVQEQLVSELVKSQEAYVSEDIHKLPETYLLTSDDAKIKEIQLLLQEKLKTPVKVIPYLDYVQAGQALMLKLVSEYNDDSFLNIVGILSSLDEMQMDLTPEEVKTQRSIEEKGRETVKSGVLAMILLALVCSFFLSKMYFKSLSLNSLAKEYGKKRKMVMALDRTAQKSRIIKDYLNGRMETLEVINEIYKIIPEEIYIQNIDIEENGTIELMGISESMSRVFNFVSALEESELFKGVKTKSTTARKERGKDVAAFELSFKLTSAKDDEVENKTETEEEKVTQKTEPPPKS